MNPSESKDLGPRLGERERAYVFAVAMKYVRSPEDADDITQDALLLAHRHRASFRGDSRFSTWLYRIAATTALMFLRRQRRKSREILAPLATGDALPALERPSPTAAPDRRLQAFEELCLAADELAAMGDIYREVFWKRFAEGRSEPEIAAELDLPLSTVKTRSFRARRAVVRALLAA